MDKTYHVYDQFKEIEEYNNFIVLKSLRNEKGIKENTFYEQLLPINELSEFFDMSNSEIIKFIKGMLNKSINLNDLFSYQFIPCDRSSGDRLIKIADKAAYSEEHIFLNGKYYTNKTVYDVCVKKNDYYSVAFNLIFSELFKKKYSVLFDPNKYLFLFNETDRFSDKEKKLLNELSITSRMSMFNYDLGKYPIGLLCSVLRDKKRINEKIYKTKITCYFDSEYVFINLFSVSLFHKIAKENKEYERTLYVPIQFFKTKDWALVENVVKHGDAYEDKTTEMGITFVEQKQGDADYFRTDLVNNIKNALMAL